MHLDRYQRHNLIDWFSQDQVKNTHVAVVGAGAVGNEVLKNLALLGVGAVDIYDFDRIEIHNLTRSVLFREDDIGLSKVETAAKRMRELDPNVFIRTYEGDFWQNLKLRMLQRYSVVISCVDNFEARVKLNLLCRLFGVDLINTGIDSRFASIDYFPFAQAKAVACYECNLPPSAYRRIAERYSCGWLKRVAYTERKVPTTIITSSITGAYAASIALRLGEHNPSQTSYHMMFDTITGYSSLTQLTPNTICPTCSLVQKPVFITSAQNILTSSLLESSIVKEENIVLRTSDQVVTRYRCVNCDAPDSWHIVFDQASKYDDSLSYCQVCRDNSVIVEIKDIFNLRELLGMYYGRKIPAKFLIYESDTMMNIFDLEDMQYE
jgi:molybdopterin-synthase adenylyltransferase